MWKIGPEAGFSKGVPIPSAILRAAEEDALKAEEAALKAAEEASLKPKEKPSSPDPNSPLDMLRAEEQDEVNKAKEAAAAQEEVGFLVSLLEIPFLVSLNCWVRPRKILHLVFPGQHHQQGSPFS